MVGDDRERLEARQRTCSVYLADRVIPMLPERLCNDVCSLRPGEDRLAMSVFVRLTSAGEVTSHRECASAIRSKARLDYDSVDDLLEGRLDASGLGCDAGVRDEVADALALLDEVLPIERDCLVMEAGSKRAHGLETGANLVGKRLTTHRPEKLLKVQWGHLDEVGFPHGKRVGPMVDRDAEKRSRRGDEILGGILAEVLE